MPDRQSSVPTSPGFVEVSTFSIALPCALVNRMVFPDRSVFEERGRGDGTGEVVRTPAPAP